MAPKKAGPSWVVQEKKGRKMFSKGIYAPKETIDREIAKRDAEVKTESYKKKLDGSRKRAAKKAHALARAEAKKKAKELKRLADKLITIAKKGDLHSRRRAISKLSSKDAVAKLFDNLGPRFKDRHGGYTRVLKAGYRSGDAAPMSIIEWTDQARTLGNVADSASDTAE